MNKKIIEKVNAIPFLGVGVAWVEEDEFIHFAKELDPTLNYLEVHPPSNFDNVPFNIPKVAHSSLLPLADEKHLNEKLVNHIFQQAKDLNCHWLGDHVSILGTSTGIDFNYIFPPVLDSSLSDRLGERVLNFIERFEIPVVMEMGPRYWSLNNEDGLSDYKLLKDVSLNTDVPIIFDIPHCLTTAKNTGVSFKEIVELLKDVKVLELHIGAEGFTDTNRTKIDEWNALELCLNTFPTIKGITMEYSNNDFKSYKENVLRLSELVAKYKSSGVIA
ncbi:DUF692 family protein [Lysinibacillus mangiferihumi]|uniref:DUF692 family protein n=1 Tax=Lysinibacillus mangiferihumi TaxID=1130819 RepID=A0A4U2Y0J3_9BACI|nr:DUF692 family multinuclear iron-containing protein [Lysinibacillus mangiferihumi]TKI52992.1 DUF692 family protein [Lysinibacillus mangiferihumi]